MRRKIKAAMKIILSNSRAGKMLKDELQGLWSYRVGKIRIVYRTAEDIIEIVAVGPRKTIYEETLQYLRKG